MALTVPARTTQETEENALSQLLSKTSGAGAANFVYAGNIAPEDAYHYLQANKAIVIDVRTLPEWQFVGVPDLAGTKGILATISWKQYPDFSPNQKFAQQLASIKGISEDTPLLFLCRSGGRSLDAAVAMTAAGYRYCFNISDGFEGDPDATGQRGKSQGWKAQQLPWKQG